MYHLTRMLRDESGGGTIMGLMWFMLLVGICGLAVDMTDGFRNRTMLQSTADSAALAAVIDLPDADAAVETAVAYAAINMGTDINGSVLLRRDVTLGVWKEDTRTFIPESEMTPSDGPIDAVHVMTKRNSDNDNSVPVNFLRIAGLQTWNVRAQAIAERFIPDCLRDGLIARNMVDISSNNSFVNEICVHGQRGVNLQSNNYFEPGVNVSMMDMSTLELPASGMESNTGLQDALRESSLDPRMVNHIDEIIQGILDRDPKYVPAYINRNEDVVTVGSNFNFQNAQPHRIYYVECRSNRNLVLPAGVVMQHTVLIADCQITIGAHSVIFNSLIASRSGGVGGNGRLNRGDANITTAAGAQLGVPDNCAPGGGVQLISNATMHFSSTTSINGVQMIALGDIALGARDMGINGISAQSGGNIYMTSNNIFGLCSGGAPNLLTVWYYRLVL
jgi:hypothetical protein